MTDDCVRLHSRPLLNKNAEKTASESSSPDPMQPLLELASISTPLASSNEPSAVPRAETTPNATSQPPAELLTLADLMERWAAALPRWDSEVNEPWFVFLERAYKAETGLAERLRRLPTCRLFMCPLRMKVSLTLAGISVSTEQGLAAACRAWAQKARAGGNS